jgi:hypothetical protein
MQPHRSGGQTALKWFLGLLVFACMGLGVYLMFKMKSGGGQKAAGNQPIVNIPAPGQGVPTNMFNDEASNSPYRISIHWTNSTANSVDADIENTSSADLPNLSLQVMTFETNEWSEPMVISYPGVDGMPAGKSGTLTVPYPFKDIERLHAYYQEDTPAGPVQHEVRIDQTADVDR